MERTVEPKKTRVPNRGAEHAGVADREKATQEFADEPSGKEAYRFQRKAAKKTGSGPRLDLQRVRSEPVDGDLLQAPREGSTGHIRKKSTKAVNFAEYVQISEDSEPAEKQDDTSEFKSEDFLSHSATPQSVVAPQVKPKMVRKKKKPALAFSNLIRKNEK